MIPLAKVPNTPPQTPPDALAVGGSNCLIYARGLRCTHKSAAISLLINVALRSIPPRNQFRVL